MKKILKKEEDFYINLKNSELRAEKKISENDQKLYEHILKSYDKTNWEDNVIVIPNLKIKIKPPYHSENVDGDNAQPVDRIKKIVREIFIYFFKKK
jgi:hypothetical protein